eukprot:9546228-Karenia_brevis.AAC.1
MPRANPQPRGGGKPTTDALPEQLITFNQVWCDSNTTPQQEVDVFNETTRRTLGDDRGRGFDLLRFQTRHELTKLLETGQI